MRGHAPTACRRAWTLVELVVSAAAATVLVAGLASAVVLASRALPPAPHRANAAAAAALVAEQLAADLTCAVQVSQLTSRRIVFSVPDRTGDGTPDTIVYDWPGTVGAALRMSRNGSGYVNVLPNVTDFTLVGGIATVTEQIAPTEQSGQALLAICTTGGATYNALVQGNLWTGNVVRPLLPSGVVRWKPTSVWLMLAASGPTTGTARVRLYAVDWNGLPTPTPLGEATIRESALSTSLQWYEYTWSDVPDLPPGAAIAFIVEHVNNPPSCAVAYRFSSAAASLGYARVASTDGGNSWNLMPTYAVIFALYGTIVREVSGGSVDHDYLTTLRFRLTTDGAADRTLETTVRLLNTPEIGG